MDNTSLEIMLITSIFAIGIALGFMVSALMGIGFIILANAILPTIIKFAHPLAPAATKP